MFIRKVRNSAFSHGAIMLRIDVTRNITRTPSLASNKQVELILSVRGDWLNVFQSYLLHPTSGS